MALVHPTPIAFLILLLIIVAGLRSSTTRFVLPVAMLTTLLLVAIGAVIYVLVMAGIGDSLGSLQL